MIVLLIQRTVEQHDRLQNHWTDYLILAVLILYTVAPSAEQVSKMFAMVALFAPGGTFSAGMRDVHRTTITESEPYDIAEGELPPELRVQRALTDDA